MDATNSNRPPTATVEGQSSDPTKGSNTSKSRENTGAQDLNSGNVLDAARVYHSLGWQPIPLDPGSKKASLPGWQKEAVPELVYADVFRGNRNIGLVLGERSGGLVDIDCDCPEAVALASRFLPKTELVFGRESARGAHRLYQITDVDKASFDKFSDLSDSGKGNGPGIVELRWNNHQTMVAPSTHPNGEQLAWERFGPPTEVTYSELRTAVGWLAAAVLLGRHWQSWEHQKHDISLALSGALLRAGATQDELTALLTAVCEIAGDPDVKDRLEAIVTTTKRLEKDEPVKGWPTLQELVGKGITEKLTEFIPAAAKAGARLVPITDLWFVAPENKFYYRPTGGLWMQSAVNAAVSPVEMGLDIDGNPKLVKASTWLGQHRRVESLTWWPGKPEVIEDHVFTEGGLRYHPNAFTLNSYRPAVIESGDATLVDPWVDHVRTLYPGEADEILDWLAYKLQYPEVKINHALVFGGEQGIGKDTILHPVREGIGPWNMAEASPRQVLEEQFNEYQRAVILRVNEAIDQGQGNRVAFGNHMKNLIANPPEVLSVNEKNRQRHYIPNLVGVVYTTNERLGALFLEDRDRRHLCCWSDCKQAQFSDNYFQELYGWLESEGNRHVVAFLRERDLSAFNPSAAPRKTDWFHILVDSGKSSEEGPILGVLEALGDPDAVTLAMIKEKAGQTLGGGNVVVSRDMFSEEVYTFLTRDGSNASVKHYMLRAGYEKVNNPDAKSGRWKVAGKDTAIYAKTTLTLREQADAARRLIETERKPIGEFRKSS